MSNIDQEKSEFIEALQDQLNEYLFYLKIRRCSSALTLWN